MKGRQLKIAILGAGLTGAYLYRLLKGTGRHEVDVFGIDPGTRCGISPCAWGTSLGFSELVKGAGLDASAYALSRPDYVSVDGLRIGADLMTFDKRRLIEDLLGGAGISPSRPEAGSYDRVIDATGVSRALLPPISDDLILSCVQFRIRTDETLESRISLGGVGYAWCFPLSNNEYHIGCGSLMSDAGERLRALGWIGGNRDQREVMCGCRGDIRLASPDASLPFVVAAEGSEVWGVGEAIGCVAPLAGDGIVPGMRSARLLMKWWSDPGGYTRAILNEFRWMKSERAVLDRLRKGGKPGLGSAWVLRRNSRRMGMQVGLRDALHLVRRLA
ncbi:MAG: hypothetical protein ABSC19_00955 [Syntrophorhabdales bacterium]|jgi:flavin-dependent dehydrogenase